MGESDWSFDHMRSSSALPLPCKEMLHLLLHLSAISCNYLSQQGQLQRLRSSCRADQPGIVAAHCFLPCCLFSFDLCSLRLVLFSQYALLIQVVTACHAHSCKQNRWPATFSKCSSLGYHRKGVCVCMFLHVRMNKRPAAFLTYEKGNTAHFVYLVITIKEAVWQAPSPPHVY